MLIMKHDCERCGTDLPADEAGAHICSFECSFCSPCTETMDANCPNCGGKLLPRPLRSGSSLAKFPGSQERTFKP